MPRVKSPRRKLEYIHTALKSRGGDPITCNKCGYTGEADLIESTALCTGYLERCPVCKSTNITYKESVMPWTIDEWKGCYPSSWKGMIVPQAMSHPAKFSSKLIRRIYEHLRAEGWVKEGDKVIDPFGGVALGSLDAMRLGLEWFGVELELKFVDLGQHNISNWDAKFHKIPKWGKAVLRQGDSRKLLQVLRGNIPGASVSSPPFADSLSQDYLDPSARREAARAAGISNSEDMSPIEMEKLGKRDQGDYGSTPGQLGAMQAGDFDLSVSSPPFLESAADGGWQMLDKYAKEGKLTVKQAKGDPSKSYPSWSEGRDTSYGQSEGQLSNMPAGDFNAAAMISSPPYTGNVAVEKNSKSINREKQYAAYKASGGGQSFEAFCATQELHSQGYGDSEGQLSAMSDGDFSVAISSPPFRHSEGGTPEPKPGGSIDSKLYARHAAGNSAAEGYGASDGQLANMGESDETFEAAMISPPYAETPGHGGSLTEIDIKKGTGGDLSQYGETEGQLTNGSHDDFWMAARQIVEQVYLALAPGGHCVWVVKDFVKNKERVPFSDQWRQLCEAVGFITLHEHRALLVHATSLTLDGEKVRKESKSFFRRLAEKKGSPRIDHETVWCMEKPVPHAGNNGHA